MVCEVSNADKAAKGLELVQLKTKKDVITMSVTTPFMTLKNSAII